MPIASFAFAYLDYFFEPFPPTNCCRKFILGDFSVFLEVDRARSLLTIAATRRYSWCHRLPAKNDPAPPIGNFADIVYLKEQSFLHIIRDVCTL